MIVRTVALVALTCACSSGPTLDTDPTVLGTATSAAVSCPADAPSGATCTALTIQCPRTDDAHVTVIASQPTLTPHATILLHNNVGGTQLLDGGFVDAYHAAGFRVAQAMWQADWEQSQVGIKHAACRYATLVDWIFTNVHAADRTHGFCAQSWGGGSGGLAFALAHYGAGSMLDAVTVSAGPPFARIDLGCAPTSPPISPCAEIQSVPVAYSDGMLQLISTWEVTPTCGTASPSEAETKRWASDSLLSAGATLAFPQTSIAAWYCANNPDAADGQGAMFLEQVTTPVSIHCVTSGMGPGTCDGQTPWPSALPDMVADMTLRCVPRH